MSITALETLYTSASTAFDAADYATAIGAATKALMLLGTTPNLARALGSGNQSIAWNDGTSIERFIANCRQLQKASAVTTGGPFRVSKVSYARATDG